MARAPMPAPQPLESPAIRRSAMLAKLLEEQRQPVEIRGGYGELAARLLGQGITQYSANKAEKTVRDERAQRIAGQSEAARLALARLIGGEQPPAPDAAPTPAPMLVPPVTNTQEPVQAQTAPAAAVAGSPMPSAAPAGMPGQPIPTADVPPMARQVAPQPMPQPLAAVAAPAPQNPLGATRGEQDQITRALSSGDPGMIAWAQGVIGEIENRMAEPAALRREFQAVNGVPGVIDPVTNEWTPTPGGIPEAARNQTFVAGPDNEYGAPAGTLLQRSPTGVISVVNRPSEGFERVDGGLRPERGGPRDPAAAGNAIDNERNLRGEFQRLTQDYREAQNGFRKVQAAAADGSGASDIALIFGFMKTLDPGSTVREGEFATVQNTGSIPDRVRAAYNQALSGERIAPGLREEFANTAARQFQTYEQGYQNRVSEYLGMAQEYGLNPRNVIGSEAPRAAQPRARPAAPARTRQPASGDDPLGLR